MSEMYSSRRLAARKAEIVARFLHPVNDAPMVTYFQTSTLRGEEVGEFYSSSEKEFHGWFEPLEQS